MRTSVRMLPGLVIVVASMVLLLTASKADFIDLTFLSTSCMIAASVSLGGYTRLFRPKARTLVIGLISAVLLYLLFVAGAAGIDALHPLGIGASSEDSIYSLIASPSNPIGLQVLVLVFDAVGYESFFRGVLQRAGDGRLGVASPFAIAAADAAIHLVSLNLLWAVTTFIVDSVWGAVFYFTGDMSSNVASHFVWDIAVFILFPIH